MVNSKIRNAKIRKISAKGRKLTWGASSGWNFLQTMVGITHNKNSKIRAKKTQSFTHVFCVLLFWMNPIN